jgi:hypothetical protein
VYALYGMVAFAFVRLAFPTLKISGIVRGGRP